MLIQLFGYCPMPTIEFAAGTIYPQSVVTEAGTTYFLARLYEENERRLGLMGEA
jgi:hypothetical protein